MAPDQVRGATYFVCLSVFIPTPGKSLPPNQPPAAPGDPNSVMYGASFDRSTAFSDVVPHTIGSAPSGVLKNNRIWDTAADGFVTPDAVTGYPTTAGYDLTTGWGSPYAPQYIEQLLAH